MEHFKNNEIFTSEQNGGMPAYINIDKLLEAMSKGKFVDIEKRESERTPKHTESFMRFESKDLDVAYRSYYHQLRKIEEMPLEVQLPELTKLFQDISLQYDPPMYCEEAYDFAVELNSSGWRKESKENPPFTSITIDDPALNLAMSQAKMLYVYWKIREQLWIRLKHFIEKKKRTIEEDKKKVVIETNRKETTVEKNKMPKEETMFYRSIGKKLEDWYEDYTERISQYENIGRQINALKNIRKQLLKLKNRDGSYLIEGGPEGIKYLIFSTPKGNHYPRLQKFGYHFFRSSQGELLDIAWEEAAPDYFAPYKTFAELGAMYLLSALSYEIDRLEETKSYDDPYKEEKEDESSSSSSLPAHFSIGEVKARKMYKAVNALQWVSRDVDENNWMYRFAGIFPQDEKWLPFPNPIMFKSTNQINFIAKKYVFSPYNNKTDDQWNLVKNVCDAEKGDIMKVDLRTKTPKGAGDFDKMMME